VLRGTLSNKQLLADSLGSCSHSAAVQLFIIQLCDNDDDDVVLTFVGLSLVVAIIHCFWWFSPVRWSLLRLLLLHQGIATSILMAVYMIITRLVRIYQMKLR